MNVLFLTLVKIRNDQQNDIYSALLSEFVSRGDSVYITIGAGAVVVCDIS